MCNKTLVGEKVKEINTCYVRPKWVERIFELFGLIWLYSMDIEQGYDISKVGQILIPAQTTIIYQFRNRTNL